ncbi:MAG: hypothetical protein EP329_12530 [Deltaproteobacteria bacterium]|nr:MAG: hypothetical protein EP329_12530 [Deltaproteobacteria bacterium]
MLPRLLAALRSQRFGVLAGFAAAFFLALGTVVMDLAPEAYAGLSLDDMRPFFREPRLVHFWFYGLALAVALWGASALVCTWDSVRTRLRHRVRRVSAYGAPLFHVAFVLALFAHLHNGLGESTAARVVGSDWTAIGDARYRLADLTVTTSPSGMPRDIRAHLERDRAGQVDTVDVAYNAPLVADVGAHALLLGRPIERPLAVLRVVGERRRLAIGDRVGAFVLTRVLQSRSLRAPMAELQFDGEPSPRWLPLTPGAGPSELVAFVGIDRERAVLLTERVNPAAPLVVVVALVAALATVLVVWEHLWRARRRARRAAVSGETPAPAVEDAIALG